MSCALAVVGLSANEAMASRMANRACDSCARLDGCFVRGAVALSGACVGRFVSCVMM